MKVKILLLLLLFLVPSGMLQVQEIPDCWCMPRYYPPGEEYFNEHFYYDTCGAKYISSDCDSAYWLNINRTFDGRDRIFAKKDWVLWFDVKAFPLPFYPPDTVIEVTWRDVDSINYPEIKDSLRMIELEYGNYTMKKIAPELNQPGIGQAFRIFFDNYVNGVELESKFRSINFAYCDFDAGTWETNNVNEHTEPDCSKIQIYPNPAAEFIIITVDDNNLKNIEIISIYGEILKTYKSKIYSDKIQIDVSEFPAGIYLIRIGNKYGKFIKM